jgi:hypothetical protein
VVVSTYTTDLTYDNGDHSGVAEFMFDAAQAGGYQIGPTPTGAVNPSADVAIGRSIAAGTIVGALLIVLGVGLIIAAIVCLIVGKVKKGRHRNQIMAGALAYGGQPAYSPPPGYAPPGYAPPPAPGYPPPAPPVSLDKPADDNPWAGPQ